MSEQRNASPATMGSSTNVADLLERVLDKGVVIAGDIRVKLLDIELLTLQIRLVICSIDKAKEMGLDWWANQPISANERPMIEAEERIRVLEEQLEQMRAAAPGSDAAPTETPPASGASLSSNPSAASTPAAPTYPDFTSPLQPPSPLKRSYPHSGPPSNQQ